VKNEFAIIIFIVVIGIVAQILEWVQLVKWVNSAESRLEKSIVRQGQYNYKQFKRLSEGQKPEKPSTVSEAPRRTKLKVQKAEVYNPSKDNLRIMEGKSESMF